MAVIETKGLTKYYGKHRGILDVELSVEEGEIYGFIGPNGAGKSTMIKTLLNMIFPTSGSARLFGMDCIADSHKIKKLVGYVPSEVRFYDDLKVKRMLAYSDSFYSTSDKAYTDELAERFELEPDKKVGELSTGNKKKTALVAALASRPKLLILDEPTNGLDPLMRQTLFDTLRQQQAKGATIFLSSHNLDEVQSLCSRVAIIRDGRIVDIRGIAELTAKSVKRVTVWGKGLPETPGVGAEVLERTEDSLVFNYPADSKTLLSMLNAMDIEDFTVEQVKLSDVFMSYYK